ncbi:MAG: outer membrane beta-barrel protein [Rubrivivax sp.]|nr:outer membrane beta-barrel protein [Rubrivivax sp.]
MKRHSVRMRGVLAACAAACVLVCTAAAAQPYAVVSVGSSRLNLDCAGVASCDKTGTGYKLLGGYRFTPVWAAEVGVFDYGKARTRDAGVSADIGNRGVGLGLAFHQALAHDWNAVARLGLSRVKTRISGSLGGLGLANDTDDNTAPYGGIGVGYRLSEAMSVDLAWDFSRSRFHKNGVDESGNINLFSLGLSFGF